MISEKPLNINLVIIFFVNLEDAVEENTIKPKSAQIN